MKAPVKPQKQIVLEMLEERGERGVHSFEFIQARIPRVAARVCELRSEGKEIESVREALHGAAEGVRYVLNVGVGAEGCLRQDSAGESQTAVSTDSGVETKHPSPASSGGAESAPPELIHHIPSAYDVWVDDE